MYQGTKSITRQTDHLQIDRLQIDHLQYILSDAQQMCSTDHTRETSNVVQVDDSSPTGQHELCRTDHTENLP